VPYDSVSGLSRRALIGLGGSAIDPHRPTLALAKSGLDQRSRGRIRLYARLLRCSVRSQCKPSVLC
jgi:hypothetical protein